MSQTEVHYCYKEVGTGEFAGRLLTPWADPYVYEYPFDFFWDNPEDAQAFLQDFADSESVSAEEVAEWVLVRETTEVVAPATVGITFPVEEG